MDVNLPPDLDRWLKSRADQIGVEPELLLHQLVDSYRTSGTEEDTPDSAGDPFAGGQPRDRFSADRSPEMDRAVLESLLDEKLDEWIGEDLEGEIDEDLEGEINDRVADAVESELDERVSDRIADAVDAELDDRIEAAISEELEATLESRVEAALGDRTDAVEDRLDALEADQRQAIEDVRDRVIQVKKEADAKTPAAAHEETRQDIEDLRGQVSALEDRIGSLSDALSALEAEADDRIEANADALGDIEADTAEIRERINTLAWNVNEIRDHVDTVTDLAPILEKAAQIDVDRAKCDRCDAAVEIGLLTEPECPHCAARLTGVVDARSFFGKPRLLVGDDAEAVPDGRDG